MGRGDLRGLREPPRSTERTGAGCWRSGLRAPSGRKRSWAEAELTQAAGVTGHVACSRFPSASRGTTRPDVTGTFLFKTLFSVP